MKRLATLVLLTFLSCAGSHAARPNVIIVMIDGKGYSELSLLGNTVFKTPHLDSLHDESIRLTDSLIEPVGTPKREQFLTGLDAARNGSIIVNSGRTLLRADLPAIANAYVSGK